MSALYKSREMVLKYKQVCHGQIPGDRYLKSAPQSKNVVCVKNIVDHTAIKHPVSG